MAPPPGSRTTISQDTREAKGARRTAKIAGVLLSELGWVPTTEEVEQVFLHPRVRDQAVLGRPTAEGSSSHTSQLAIF